MPDCNENFENEICNGRNLRSVSCKYCSSIVLIPGSASFTTFEFQLPLITQSKTNDNHVETEDVSLFWEVKDIYTFHNIAFSNTIGNSKLLTCADCEIGPIGYHDIPSKISLPEG